MKYLKNLLNKIKAFIINVENKKLEQEHRDDLLITGSDIRKLNVYYDTCKANGFEFNTIVIDNTITVEMTGHGVTISKVYVFNEKERMYIPSSVELSHAVVDFAKTFVMKDEILKRQRAQLDNGGVLTIAQIQRIEQDVTNTMTAITELRTALGAGKNAD